MEFYLSINKNLNPETIPLIRAGKENSFDLWPLEQVRDVIIY